MSDGNAHRVLVAGASGGTGRAILDELRDTDHEVVALTRSGDKRRDLLGNGADEVVVGDLLNRRDAKRAVEGCTAVVCVVGASPGMELLGPLPDGEGTIHLVDAASEADVERFVLVSSLGVGDSASAIPLPLRLAFRATGILGAKERAEDHLLESGLSYTILRPGGLTDDPATGDVVVGEGGDTVSGSIPRADLARVAVAALLTPDAAGRTFEVVARPELRGEPSGVVDLDWQWPGGA